MRIRSLCLLLVAGALAGCGPMATAAPLAAAPSAVRPSAVRPSAVRPRAVMPARVSTGDDLPGVLLSAGDLPTGWTALMAGTGNAASEISGCGATAATQDRRAAVAFSRAVLGPYLAETLSVTPSARETVDRLRQVIADCAQVSATRLDVPAMGDDSTAFALEAGIPGVGMSLHAQVVAASRGDVLMTVTVVGMSAVDTATTVMIARTALAKLG